jgi:Uma2 family endonuclease
MNFIMESEPRKHLITVEEYYRMAEVGLLAPDARVELIEGEIIDMVPIGSRHARAVNHLSRQFTRAAGDLALVRSQSPVRLDGSSQPEPDIALVAPRADEYGVAHPAPADVLLIVEVSDSTLHHDRDVKLPLYARHGIPEVWIVDLQGGRLHIHRVSDGERYQEQSTIEHPGIVKITALPGIQVDLSGLLVD